MFKCRICCKKNLHLFKRNIFDKATNDSPRLFFTDIDFFNIQRISIRVFLNFLNNPNTDIKSVDRYFLFHSSSLSFGFTCRFSWSFFLSTFICKHQVLRKINYNI
ncbi:hypothetical protein Hanom_Chr14g01269641 [Helianthus anomalus]